MSPVLAAIILAAGQGTRMNSDLPKVIHKVCNRPMVYWVVKAAREAGAECLVVDCPMCQSNLDTRQAEIEKEQGVRYNLPVFYITELMALAFGDDEAAKWWKKHFVDPTPLLKSKGLL